jgi:hypothetical protein
LKLSGIGAHQQTFHVNFDWENLEELELERCHVTEIIAWNSSKSLKKVTIFHCPLLSSIPPLDDIPEVFIAATTRLTHFQSTGNHEKFTCVGSTLDNETLQLMNQPSFYKSLQKLHLWCAFNIPDLSFCQYIPVVHFYNQSNGLPSNLYPSLPVLYGKELKLNNFSLAQWNGQTFANLVNCELKNCINLIDFPDMGMLQSLQLKNCVPLVGIPCLSSLRTLSLVFCSMIKRVSFSPNLIKVAIEHCNSFEDLSTLSHVPEVTLSSCNRVISIIPLQRVPKVNIRTSIEIKDWERISNPEDDYMQTNRTITIFGLVLRDNLQNISHLVFECCAMDLSLITKIHHLEIISCTDLMTTEGLGSVTGSLILSHCWNVTSLIGLENIPEVSVISCKNIVDFSGLGHHQKLTVCGNLTFKKVLKEFQKEGMHSELFDSIDHLYFDSKGSYPTPKCIW